MNMECKDSCSRYHKMLLKAALAASILRGINGFVSIRMMSPSRYGKQALIICFDHVDLKRISALCLEKPVEVTNWSARGVERKCDPPASIREACWWIPKYNFLTCVGGRVHVWASNSEGQDVETQVSWSHTLSVRHRSHNLTPRLFLPWLPSHFKYVIFKRWDSCNNKSLWGAKHHSNFKFKAGISQTCYIKWLSAVCSCKGAKWGRIYIYVYDICIFILF